MRRCGARARVLPRVTIPAAAFLCLVLMQYEYINLFEYSCNRDSCPPPRTRFLFISNRCTRLELVVRSLLDALSRPLPFTAPSHAPSPPLHMQPTDESTHYTLAQYSTLSSRFLRLSSYSSSSSCVRASDARSACVAFPCARHAAVFIISPSCAQRAHHCLK